MVDGHQKSGQNIWRHKALSVSGADRAICPRVFRGLGSQRARTFGGLALSTQAGLFVADFCVPCSLRQFRR